MSPRVCRINSLHTEVKSELSGLYGISHTVPLLASYHQVMDGALEVGCDGKVAVLRSMDPEEYILNPRKKEKKLHDGNCAVPSESTLWSRPSLSPSTYTTTNR